MKHGLFLLTLLCRSVCFADVILTLDSTTFPGQPGTGATFFGSVSNTGSDAVFINSAFLDISSADILLDATPLFVSIPVPLGGGQVYGGPLFDAFIAPSAVPLDYFGTFTLQGGIDSSTYDDVATQNFVVSVAVVPEPGSAILLGISAAALLFMHHRRGPRRHRIQNRC